MTMTAFSFPSLRTALSTFSSLILLGLCVTAVATTPCHAVPIAADSFITTEHGDDGTYTMTTEDSRIFGQDVAKGTSGFNGAWSSANNYATKAILVQTAGLVSPLSLSAGSNGSVRFMANSGQRLTTRLFSPDATKAIAEAGELYFSCLLRTAGNTSYKETASYMGLGATYNTMGEPSVGVFFGYQDGNLSLFYKDAKGNFASAPVLSSPAENTTYLGVVRIQFGVESGKNDRITVDVYEESSTPGKPSATITVVAGKTNKANDLAHLLILVNGRIENLALDEFRLGTSLADVMAVKK